MSYDSESSNPDSRSRRGRRRALVTLAALAPTVLAGWLVSQAMADHGRQDDKPPKALPSHGAPSSPPGAGTATLTVSGSPRPGSSAPSAPPQGGSGTGALAGKTVVIDPGHNPNNFRHTKEINEPVDIGTNEKECDTTGTETNDGYTEAEFTLDVSHRIRAILEKQGAKVIFTQNGDRTFGPCVDERARIGNRAKADAVVSVHADGAAQGQRGFHVILPANVKGGAADTAPIVGPSRELGVRIAGKFVQDTGMNASNYVGDGTALDVRSDLGGLNLSTVPKVFIECGNMRDSRDSGLLKSTDWHQKAAQGIADGIMAFLGG
ncbi:N-acetylmuramoyl-L-alanine amidase [Streptomyces sp. NBC_00083]|uniref:N-acetylmuramoyl-L-alanine amidase n=1 Tax=Streptomyces sp. NBC_00083 TaxID=2975647 RepID=UPI0022535757|nr:N-acetylmuramoyl-L-alanine amidase [Streptomyces sp. NBC_00083]MCX5382743.1 N-acetylmuramoyl-L-alanine amidase [Streptomyces sp. NBC_00083]